MSLKHEEHSSVSSGDAVVPLDEKFDWESLLNVMKDEISVVIRKTRAQTLWDAFAREMTPVATKVLSIINPHAVPVEPVDRTYHRGGVSLASSSLQGRSEETWGYNQQLDFLLRILQDGLFCLDPNAVSKLGETVDELLPSDEEMPPPEQLVSQRFSILCKVLQEQSPFKLADTAYDKIEQIVPEQFAYDDNNVDDKGDRRRLYKLARILFFLRYYQNQEETPESFASFFCAEVDRVLVGFKNNKDYVPVTNEEHNDLFTRLNKHFDNTIIEEYLNRAIKSYCPRSANQISFHKKINLPERAVTPESGITAQFVTDNRHLPELAKLAKELKEGHYSLVGGRDYTRMRFPEAILKRIALGAIRAVIVDGTLEEALEYVRDTYTEQAKDILQFQVCGQYGDFSKVYIRYQIGDKIEQLFLVAQPGESRVLSNAAALLNYAGKKDLSGKLLPEPAYINMDRIECVYRKEPLNGVIREEIKSLLASVYEEAKILGEHELTIPTTLMPATSAETLIQSLTALGYVEYSSVHRFDTAGRITVATLKDPKSGHKERVIMPSVGGSGLYGDTAGIFVEEYLNLIATSGDEENKLNLSNDIKFFATAGAITNQTFHPHEGQICSPLGDYISYDFKEQVSAPRVTFNHRSIIRYQNHGWAPCPAVETSAFFEDRKLHPETPLGMIDVEGLFVARAVVNAGIGTFTPLYYVSDLIKPKRNNFNRLMPDFDSYAYGCRAGMAIRLSKPQTRALAGYIFAK